MGTDLSSPGHGFRAGSVRRSSPPLSGEEGLVARCLQREETAWEMIFHYYHPQLVGIIRSMMSGTSGKDQAEEIAAVVWSSLFCSESDSRLRRYDARTGRLLVYLASMARKEIWRGRRSERNRHFRECKVARVEATADDIGRRLDIQDFLATLTPREREFFLSHLVRQSTHTVQSEVSSANGWQLRSRVLRKFRRYFSQNK
jgi:DNA-directed RNA polymerase specialized sigma24 family protein